MTSALLFGLLCILSLGDIFSTWMGLKSKYIYERNKTLVPFMDQIGVLPTLLLSKTLFLSLIWWFGMYVPLLLVINFMYAILLGNNIFVLVKANRIQNLVNKL